jgi:cell division protein FtsW
MISMIQDKPERNELDFWLIVSLCILLAVSLSMIYSASLLRSQAIYNDKYFILKSQVLWMIVGLVALIIFSNVDYRVYQRYSKFFILAALILMVFVFLPGLGHQVGKAKRWIKVGFVGFQPSELAKVALVIYMADLLTRKKEIMHDFKESFLPALLVLGAFVVLLLLQSNLGTAVFFLLLAFVMFFLAGMGIRQMVAVFLGILPVVIIAVIKESYRLKRIFGYLDPWAYPDTIGYNIIQSWKSFYNGGLFGVGLGQGIQKMWYLPAPHTDFIFAVAGEEAGLLGVLIILFLFGVILVRGMSIAAHASDMFSKLLAAGLTLMICLQAIVNMSVVTGLLPTTGLVLPFLSYGGTALVINMTTIGILLNIHKQNVENRSPVT